MPLGSKTKGAIILLCTLLVGIALGSLGMGALTRQRLQLIPNPYFFTRHTLRLIQPHDEAQRAQVRSIRKGAKPRFKELIRTIAPAMQSLADSVYGELKPHVDAEQWARIEDRDRRFREMMGRWGAAPTARPPSPQGGAPTRQYARRTQEDRLPPGDQ